MKIWFWQERAIIVLGLHSFRETLQVAQSWLSRPLIIVLLHFNRSTCSPCVFSTSGDTVSTSGDILSTSGDILSTSMVSWVHQGDIITHVGEQVDKSLWFILKTSMYWTSPDVLMISPRCTHGILRRTEHPPMYWTSSDVLNTHYTGWCCGTCVNICLPSWYTWKCIIHLQ